MVTEAPEAGAYMDPVQLAGMELKLKFCPVAGAVIETDGIVTSTVKLTSSVAVFPTL